MDDNHTAGYGSNLQFADSQMYWFIFSSRPHHVFQGRNTILLLSIQSVVRLIEVFNDRNWPNTIYFSVRVREIEVSTDKGFVIKGKYKTLISGAGFVSA